MKVLLVAVNAKYIHTCPAVYSLKACADRRGIPGLSVEIAEYTINDRYQDVLAGILSYQADVVAFSTYIWNVDRIRRLIRDVRLVWGPEGVDMDDPFSAGSRRIWLGGPEATWYPAPFLKEDGADLCMLGEGEEIFPWLCETCMSACGSKSCDSKPADPDPDGYPKSFCPESFCPEISLRENLPAGLAFLRDGELVSTGPAAPVDMNQIPFLYDDLSLFSNRILYYEASRGCPFSCAYCLSGRERGIRYRDPDIVEKELQYFLDQQVTQVKFVDRTFNADPVFAMRVWQYLQDHDNGVTNFHFEIEADRITDEELELLGSLRPGLIQMEIGVQSANPVTLRAVHRRPDLTRIAAVMSALTGRQNINLHLDLIAGLPFEDLDSFRHSFNTVYVMRPHQFQVGFLKLLKGTELYDRREEYGLVCSEDSPYEVLRTKWISYEELEILHRVSDRVEEYVNTQGFRRSLPLAERLFPDAFSLFRELAEYYRVHGYEQRRPSVFQRYVIFADFLKETAVRECLGGEELSGILETVRLDQHLHTHPSRRMTAEETFDLPEGRVRLRFDYRHTSPVNEEASVVTVPE